MPDFLERIIGFELEQVFAAWALALVRFAPMTAVAPWLAFRELSPLLRSLLVLGLSLGLSLPTLVAPPPIDHFVLALAQELVVGLMFAVATALPFWAAEWAGRYIDLWRGASMAEVFAPLSGRRTSPVGDLYLMVAIAAFFILGFHLRVLRILGDSLATAPIGKSLLLSDPSFTHFSELVGEAFALSLSLAAPGAIAILVGEIAIGLVARSAPRVPVFFVAMPLRAAIGLLAVLLTLPFLFDVMGEAFFELLAVFDFDKA